MPRIQSSCLDAIRLALPLREAVSRYGVALKPSGANWKGLSPFTQEKSPSFYVLEEKQIFKCFSSGYAGDVFELVQRMENVGFTEAVEQAAQWAGVTLVYESVGGAAPVPSRGSLRQELLQLHQAAAVFFVQAFRKEKAIQDYWTQVRGFSLGLAESAGVGYAPADLGALAQGLSKEGFSWEALGACGLFYQSAHASSWRDLRPRFRGRLMLPIADLQGRVVAFAGRQTAQTPNSDPTFQAKYINSPETPLFHKGKLVLGLDHARHHLKEQPAVWVEGPLDVLRCWDCGVHQAVAAQGTGVTLDQLALVKRYTGCLDCFLDGDAAGQRAALRLLGLAFRLGFQVRFLKLPEGEDPDSYLRKHGAAGFALLQERALGAMPFLQQVLLPAKSRTPAYEKLKALEALFEVLAGHPSEVLIQDYLHAFASVALLDPAALAQDYSRFRNKSSSLYGPEEVESKTFSKKEEKNSIIDLTKPEFELIYLLLNEPMCQKAVVEGVLAIEGWRPSCLQGELLGRLVVACKEGVWKGIHHLENLGLSPQQEACLFSVAAEAQRFEDPEQCLAQALRALQARHYRQQLQLLDAQLASVPVENFLELHAVNQARKQLRERLMACSPAAATGNAEKILRGRVLP